MAKKVKIEKETRKLMEAMGDLIKKSSGGKYKFKSKSKKTLKSVKKNCIHWIVRKGNVDPTVNQNPDNGEEWRCKICSRTFPIKPLTREQYSETITETGKIIDQLLFYSVKLGGDADDTKLMLDVRKKLPEIQKIAKAISKAISKRDQMEANRKNTDATAQFSAYSGYNYRG